MPVENKIHQGRRTIPHLVWLSFTFQPTGCLPGEFIIDQRQWSCLPRPPLFPPSFPISSFFPAVTIFSLPSCQLPAQGCVRGVCKSYKALGKAHFVATRRGIKGKGPDRAARVGMELSSHAVTAPWRLCYREQQGTWGRQKLSLQRLGKKSHRFNAKMRPEQCNNLWMNIFHPALPVPLNFHSQYLTSPPLKKRQASAIRKTMG